MTDYGIILAAGASERMGRPKQLLELDGQSLLARAVSAVRGVDASPVVVLGARATEIAETIRAEHIVNSEWKRGMGTSLARGVAHVRDRATRILVLTIDQPDIDARLLQKCLDACDNDVDASATVDTSGRLGPPACFRASMFDALVQCSGDSGARELLRSEEYRVARVDAGQRAADIDTPSEWQAYLKSRAERPEGPS